jgi:hypothetical protein
MTANKRLNYIPWEPSRAAVSRIERSKPNRAILPEQSISTQLYRYQNNSKPPSPTPVIGQGNRIKPTATVEPFQASINVDDILYGTRFQPSSLNNSSVQELNLSNEQLEFKNECERLQEENAGLKQQLEIQTQVNAELKKLLVASVGTDFQYRLERLLR